MSRPSERSSAVAPASASVLPPWPLRNTTREAQLVADLPNSTSRSRSAAVPMEMVPGKLSCSPLAP
jgi:hypothetical protein